MIQGNGTMVAAGGYAGGGGGYSVVDQTAYQIPPGYGGYADGFTRSCGGADYVVQNNLMFRIRLGGGGYGPGKAGPISPGGKASRPLGGGPIYYRSGYSGIAAGPNGPMVAQPNRLCPGQGGGRAMLLGNQGGGSRPSGGGGGTRLGGSSGGGIRSGGGGIRLGGFH